MSAQVTNCVGNPSCRVLVKSGHEKGRWHFYCGKKRDTDCPLRVCDLKCGPKDGCNCSACALLDRTISLPPPDMSSMSGTEKVNRKGHKAKKLLVTSGHEKDKYHYYCGHKRDTVCSYDRCNDVCGPTTGCNCSACAELDRYEGLPPVSVAVSSHAIPALVNSNGNSVKYINVSSGHEAGKYHHYCGKKRDTVCPVGRCNDICGPASGCNCSACRYLDYCTLPYSTISSHPTVVYSQPPVVQYQSPPPQAQYNAHPQVYQPPPQHQHQDMPPQSQPQAYYQAPAPSPQQYQVPVPQPQQYQVPPQYYPPPSTLPPAYSPEYSVAPQQQPVQAGNSNNGVTAASTSSSSSTSTAAAAAATAATVLSTGFKFLKPVVKTAANAATTLVKTAAQHIVDNDKDNACVICMEKPKNASLVHGQSAHQCCCVECGELLKKTGQACPICRAAITMVVRNYSS